MCKKKILFATSDISSKGGIPRFNSTLVKALAKYKCEITIVCLNSDNVPPFIIEEGVKLGNNVVNIHCCNKGKVRFLLRCLTLSIKFRPDIAICGHLNQGIPLSLIFKFCGINSRVLILHGIEVWGKINSLMRFIFPLFNNVLAVSSYTRNSYLQQIPSLKSDVCKIFPNTIDSYLLGIYKNYNKIPHEKVCLLSVSRLDVTERDKGIIDVIYALSKLNIDNLIYKIVGDGNDRKYLESIVSDLNVGHAVEFAGRISDEGLLEAYQSADIFILPSSKEGFGIVYLEAMLFQLPVIAAKEKGALDVVEDGVNGLLCDFGDRKSIKGCIDKLINDSCLRSEMGKKGYEYVTEDGKFSYESYLSRVNSLILLQ